jgi:hypothetical protein
MRKNLILALAVISILIISTSTITTSRAATYNSIGVIAGDWIDYSVKYYSTSPADPGSDYSSGGYNRIGVSPGD